MWCVRFSLLIHFSLEQRAAAGVRGGMKK